MCAFLCNFYHIFLISKLSLKLLLGDQLAWAYFSRRKVRRCNFRSFRQTFKLGNSADLLCTANGASGEYFAFRRQFLKTNIVTYTKMFRWLCNCWSSSYPRFYIGVDWWCTVRIRIPRNWSLGIRNIQWVPSIWNLYCGNIS